MSGEPSTVFQPDPLYTRLRGVRVLLDEYDDLEELRSTLEEQIETWESEYRVELPETLRGRAARTDNADRTRQLRRAANEWEIVRYRLGLVDEAIDLSTE